MNERIFAVLIFLIAFIVSLYSAASIPNYVWQTLGSWQTATIGLGILVSFSALLLSYWVYTDYEAQRERFEDLENRLHKIQSIADDKALAERLAKYEKEKKQ